MDQLEATLDLAEMHLNNAREEIKEIGRILGICDSCNQEKNLAVLSDGKKICRECEKE